jgi:hypothetical protein
MKRGDTGQGDSRRASEKGGSIHVSAISLVCIVGIQIPKAKGPPVPLLAKERRDAHGETKDRSPIRPLLK